MRETERGMSMLEVATAISLASILTIIAVPVFYREWHASHQAEASEVLLRIGERVAAFVRPARHQHALPDAIARTPAEVPRAATSVASEADWAPWSVIGGRPVTLGFPQRYAYSFLRTPGDKSAFEGLAEGDLDGDGIVSRVSLRGSVDASGSVQFAPDVELVDGLE